jgi:hypothetical protein
MSADLAGRDAKMAQIIANMDSVTTPEEDEKQPQTVGEKIEAERLRQLEIKTEGDILKLEEMKKNAQSKTVKEKLAEEIRLAKERKAQIAAEKEQRTKTFQTVQDVHKIGSTIGADIKTNVDGTVNKVQKTAADVAQNLESVSTPGSIWLPISVLLVFFFLLLPVNGMTRAQWLYQTLIGNAQIGGAASNPQPSNNSTMGGGAVGGYGSGGNIMPIRRFVQ